MTEESKKKVPGVDMEAGRIAYDYIKSNYFRVIHVDGVFGGNTPRANLIQMCVWNERWPIPKQTVFKLNPEGSLGDEITEDRISRNAIVREVEAELIFDIPGAKRIRDWLDTKISQIEEKKGEEQ